MEKFKSHSSGRSRDDLLTKIWGVSLIVWIIAMWLISDPRPLSVPDWSVRTLQSVGGLKESAARVAASFILRGIGVGMIGVLLALALQGLTFRWSAIVAIVTAPILAVVVKWINFGYFPIRHQLSFIIVVAVLGALAGLALGRSRGAAIALVVLCVALLAWGTSTGVSGDLERAARATGLHLLDSADEISDGDDAFYQMLDRAFAFAEDNSRGTDPVLANQAAILALGVILGDDKVVQVGRSEIDNARKAERESLRRTVTIHGRNDLSRHFSVSAGLTVLSDAHRALAVGIVKETSDSNPGGSGFSFVDMTANKAGIRFAVLATQDAKSARAMQMRMIHGSKRFKFVPSIDGLPENLTSDEFQTDFGGLGGTKTREIFGEIDRRINECDGLK